MRFRPIVFSFLIGLFITACSKTNNTTLNETPPTITSINPITGPYGTIDTIVGANFSPNDSVAFNGVVASIIYQTNDTLIVVVPKRAGTGPVAIRTNHDTAKGPVFTYIYTVSVATLAGNGIEGYLDGQAAAAEFFEPHSVTVDQAGNIFVIDGSIHGFKANRIRKISTEGMVSTLAGADSAGFQDGQGTQAVFKCPLGGMVNNNGDIFIADSYNHRVRKVTVSGMVTTLAGSGIASFADGDAINSEFNVPYNVVVDLEGNSYVTDCFNHSIRKITSNGTVSTFAGNGVQGWVDGTQAGARFSYPAGLTIDIQNNLYVTEGSRVRKITSSGNVSTIAGNHSGGQTGYRDGVAADALFSNPNGLTIDKQGNIYLADTYNQVIRKMSPDGIVSTLAGNGNQGFVEGNPLQAEFSDPESVAVDREGNVYVADTYNNRIRKILIE